MTVDSAMNKGADWPLYFIERSAARFVRSIGIPAVFLALSVAPQYVIAGPMPRFELTPFVGYRVGGSFEDSATGSTADLDENASYGLIFNIREKGHTQYEFSWSHQGTSVDFADISSTPVNLDLDIDWFQIGGTYLWEGDRARPFLVATIGAAHYRSHEAASESDTYFAFSIGGGWKLWPTRRFGLRLEGRFYGTLLDSNSRIFCSSAPESSGCLIQTTGKLLSQWEIMAGGAFRF